MGIVKRYSASSRVKEVSMGIVKRLQCQFEAERGEHGNCEGFTVPDKEKKS